MRCWHNSMVISWTQFALLLKEVIILMVVMNGTSDSRGSNMYAWPNLGVLVQKTVDTLFFWTSIHDQWSKWYVMTWYGTLCRFKVIHIVKSNSRKVRINSVIADYLMLVHWIRWLLCNRDAHSAYLIYIMRPIQHTVFLYLQLSLSPIYVTHSPT